MTFPRLSYCVGGLTSLMCGTMRLPIPSAFVPAERNNACMNGTTYFVVLRAPSLPGITNVVYMRLQPAIITGRGERVGAERSEEGRGGG